MPGHDSQCHLGDSQPRKVSIMSADVTTDAHAPSAAASTSPRGFLRRSGGAFQAVPDATWHDWRWQVRHRITKPDELARLLDLSPEAEAALDRAARSYPLSVVPYY